jgi:septal ring factor EnvC (AmiA/AmiB activator)
MLSLILNFSISRANLHTLEFNIMATDKTPAHKRIRRAEEGRNQWKNKAQLRREENEKLKRDLETKTTRLVELVDENQKFKDQLTIFQKQIQTQEKLIENLKKKTH